MAALRDVSPHQHKQQQQYSVNDTILRRLLRILTKGVNGTLRVRSS
jgi:hypothetical protein